MLHNCWLSEGTLSSTNTEQRSSREEISTHVTVYYLIVHVHKGDEWDLYRHVLNMCFKLSRLNFALLSAVVLPQVKRICTYMHASSLCLGIWISTRVLPPEAHRNTAAMCGHPLHAPETQRDNEGLSETLENTMS